MCLGSHPKPQLWLCRWRCHCVASSYLAPVLLQPHDGQMMTGELARTVTKIGRECICGLTAVVVADLVCPSQLYCAMERTRVYVVYNLDSSKRTNAWRDLYCIAYLHKLEQTGSVSSLARIHTAHAHVVTCRRRGRQWRNALMPD